MRLAQYRFLNGLFAGILGGRAPSFTRPAHNFVKHAREFRANTSPCHALVRVHALPRQTKLRARLCTLPFSCAAQMMDSQTSQGNSTYYDASDGADGGAPPRAAEDNPFAPVEDNPFAVSLPHKTRASRATPLPPARLAPATAELTATAPEPTDRARAGERCACCAARRARVWWAVFPGPRHLVTAGCNCCCRCRQAARASSLCPD